MPDLSVIECVKAVLDRRCRHVGSIPCLEEVKDARLECVDSPCWLCRRNLAEATDIANALADKVLVDRMGRVVA